YLASLAILVPFDRYLLLCLPLLMVVLVCASPVFAVRLGGPRSFLAACLLLALAVFGVGGTHDYFAWQRARWQALRELTEVQKIPAEKIDGGFEFNGLHFYDPHYADRPGKSWWWVQDDEYVIAFAPFDNYMEVDRHPYTRWIPPSRGYIFTLQRKDGNERDIILAATLRHGGQNLLLSDGDVVRYWSGDGRSAPVALSYGNYLTLPPGRYVATLYYRAKQPRRAYRNSWGQLRLVQFDNGPAIVEAEIEPVANVANTYHRQSLAFSLEQELPVEVQIIGGDARLWLYRVVFSREADSQPELSFSPRVSATGGSAQGGKARGKLQRESSPFCHSHENGNPDIVLFYSDPGFPIRSGMTNKAHAVIRGIIPVWPHAQSS
ncbi:MAG: hypothetical protein HYV36_01145, partial [Lentisphaerae bacterium]|nr:hypothetical protein [Lentisphaerota bacterium]